MNPTIDFALQAKRKAYIALLDQAIEIGEALGREFDKLENFLEERFPDAKAA